MRLDVRARFKSIIASKSVFRQVEYPRGDRKTPRIGVRHIALSGLLGLVLGSAMIAPAQAGTTPALFFDTNGATTGYGTGGSWDAANWATVTGGASSTTTYTAAQTAANTTATYEAFNGSASMTVTVSADEIMSGLLQASANILTINQSGAAGDLNITSANGYAIGSTTAGSGIFQEFRITSASGGVIINASITGNGGLRQNGSGYLALYGNNSYTGGTLATGAQTIFYNNANSFGTGAITIAGGVTTTLTNNTLGTTIANNLAFNATGYVVNFQYNNAAFAGTLSSPGAVWTGNFALAPSGSSTLLGGQANNFTQIGGTISGSSGTTLMVGNTANTGTLIFSGNNTYTGATTVSAGTLVLTGSNTTSGVTVSNQGTLSISGNGSLANTTALTLNSGNLNFSGTAAQALASTTISAGASSITDSGSAALNLGAIMRNTGGAVNFVPSGSGVITTTTANNANGILGGYATFGGTSFATFNGASGIVGLADASYGTNYTTAGAATEFDATTSGTFTNTGVDSLRFNSAASNTAMLSGAFTVGSGGILQSANVGANASTITGGTSLTSGNGTDLIVHNYDTTAGGTLTIATPIVGAIGLTTAGGGTTILTGANTYSSATTIGAGTLQIGAGGMAGTLGTGAIVDNGTLVFNRSDATSIVAGAISGVGGVNQIGTGTTTLSGANTYAGITSISAGTLQIGAGSTTGTLGTGAVTDNGTLLFNRITTAFTTSNAISGTGVVIDSGSAALTLSGANTYSGGTTVASGATVIAGSSTAFGSGALAVNGAMYINGQTLTIGGLSGASTGRISDQSATAGTLVIAQTGTSTYSGNINNGTATNESTTAVTFNGAGGILTLAGTNSYSGGTTVTNGTLIAGSTAAFSNSSNSSRITVNAANGAASAIQLNGNNITTLGGLSGTVSGTGTATISNTSTTAATLTDAQTNATTYGGVLVDGAGGGALGLTMNGVGGVLTLSGTNTYTGATNVIAGALSVTGSTASTGTVNVGDGTTTTPTATLSGTGSVGNVVLKSNGVISPGAGTGVGAAGTFSSASLTWNASGTIDFDLGSDLVSTTVFSGNGGITGSYIFAFTGGTAGATYNLVDYANISGGVTNVANFSATGSTTSGMFQFGTDSNTGQTALQFIFAPSGSAMPEPGTLGLLSLSGVAALPFASVLRRRKCRS